MPIYEFRCLACNHIFELLSLAKNDPVELKCPECQAAEVERVLSRASYVMGSSSGSPKTSVTTKSCSGGSCATIDIPGHSR
jgi:putative FmdB family regulatory protein